MVAAHVRRIPSEAWPYRKQVKAVNPIKCVLFQKYSILSVWLSFSEEPRQNLPPQLQVRGRPQTRQFGLFAIRTNHNRSGPFLAEAETQRTLRKRTFPILWLG